MNNEDIPRVANTEKEAIELHKQGASFFYAGELNGYRPLSEILPVKLGSII